MKQTDLAVCLKMLRREYETNWRTMRPSLFSLSSSNEKKSQWTNDRKRELEMALPKYESGKHISPQFWCAIEAPFFFFFFFRTVLLSVSCLTTSFSRFLYVNLPVINCTGKCFELFSVGLAKWVCLFWGLLYNNPCYWPITARALDQLLYNMLFLVSEQLL